MGWTSRNLSDTEKGVWATQLAMRCSGVRGFGDPFDGTRRLWARVSSSGAVVLDELRVLLSYEAVAGALAGLPA
eukprot:6977021-Pyramimonas_sp.AAC.1